MGRHILISGGAGFIGANAAVEFARDGWKVSIVDNLSRARTPLNLEWIRSHQIPIDFNQIDIRDTNALADIFQHAKYDAVLHLAAQVAVTWSVEEPRHDFEVNALGSFNMLEMTRRYCPQAAFVLASTNKVYGKMEHVAIAECNGRYEYRDLPLGADESQPLDFHSPYGCSKGTADQYTLDYARIYGMRTAVMRQSCIYGPRQFGVEDQGWVAWFIIAALLGNNITIYGDGKQIRDVLHVSDLVSLYKRVIENIDSVKGHAFNVGGGAGNTLSLLELIALLERKLGRKIDCCFENWRAGDQKVFVCNIDKLKCKLGWEPHVDVDEGVNRLISWVHENEALFSRPVELVTA